MLDVNLPQHPILRRLDVQPIVQYGRQYVLLRDPLQLTDQQLLVPRQVAPALGLCDGHRSIDQICVDFGLRSGISLQQAQLNDMLQALDDAYMLEGPRYESMLAEARNKFRSALYREPALADLSYPAEPVELKQQLDGYLADVHVRANGQENQSENIRNQNSQNRNGHTSTTAISRGLLSPHIDYMRGGHIYAQVWKDAEDAAQAADLVVMFGTDHNGTDPFTLTRQNYATPYGVLPTPCSIVDALVATVDSQLGEGSAYAGELRHRREHSLELVAVWLHHMRQGRPCQLVPILVGSFHPYILDNRNPVDDPLIMAVFDTLCTELKAAQANGKNVLVVASGDLAHVGPEFDGEPLNGDRRQKLLADDQRLIDQMQAGDAAEFFEEIRQVKDRNNVCGVSPIYLSMKLLELLGGSVSGELTGYETCPADKFDTSAVTVGGVIFS